MTKQARYDDLLELLRQASDQQPIPTDGHFVEDDELLACWAQDLLSPREHREIIDHLSLCPRCRREVADMIRAGVLDPPPAQVDGRRRGSRRAWVGLVLAVAAVLLVGLGVAWWTLPRGSQRAELALRRAAEQRAREPRAIGALLAYDCEIDGPSLTAATAQPDPAREQQLETQYRENPRDPLTLLELGLYHLEQHELDKAHDWFEDALTANPKSILAHLGLGMAAFQRYVDLKQNGDEEAARRQLSAAGKEFRTALDMAPDDLDAQLNWGIYLRHTGDLEGAKSYFRAVLARTTNPQIRAHLDAWLKRHETGSGAVAPEE